MGKNIIGYSLWGDMPIYWVGALRNIELAKKHFPGWICRFYIDNKCDPKLIEIIKGDNVEVVLVDSSGNWRGMFWRFWAAADPEVDVFLSRDCDSRFSNRELLAINEWLLSDKDFHIMRDHVYHNVPILGGMFGCRNGILRDLDIIGKINSWTNFDGKGCDQEFLAQVIYPLVKDRAMEHSEFNLNYGGEIRPFPHIRKDYEFVGDIFDENDVRHPDHWKIIKSRIG